MSSRLVVNSVRHTGASADAITMDASGNVTFPGNATCSGTTSGFGKVLANYFASCLIMPYDQFWNAAKKYRYDIDILSNRFDASFEQVLGHEPEVILFSNGPGDPSSVLDGINLAKSLINYGKIPMFGICLGHQIFGLALGGETYKLSFGHRGLNHPCGKNNKIEITSQNHGFAIDPNSLSKEFVEITHYNLNDNTVAGLKLKNKPIFSVQYHPEAGPGPHDSDYLFEKFVSLMLERC